MIFLTLDIQRVSKKNEHFSDVTTVWGQAYHVLMETVFLKIIFGP
jgi:hypothetical protein